MPLNIIQKLKLSKLNRYFLRVHTNHMKLFPWIESSHSFTVSMHLSIQYTTTTTSTHHFESLLRHNLFESPIRSSSYVSSTIFSHMQIRAWVSTRDTEMLWQRIWMPETALSLYLCLSAIWNVLEVRCGKAIDRIMCMLGLGLTLNVSTNFSHMLCAKRKSFAYMWVSVCVSCKWIWTWMLTVSGGHEHVHITRLHAKWDNRDKFHLLFSHCKFWPNK